MSCSHDPNLGPPECESTALLILHTVWSQFLYEGLFDLQQIPKLKDQATLSMYR